jgi:integrase
MVLNKEYEMATKNTPPRPARTVKKEKNANGQGTVYWSESRKRWISQYTDIQGLRRTKVCRKQVDAQTWLDEQKRAKHFGQSTYTPYPKMTLGEFLNQWLELRKNTLAPETYRNYKGSIENRIIPVLGNHKANALTAHAIENLLGAMVSNGYQPGTVNGVYAVLRAAYKYAVRMGDLTVNPMEKVTKPKLQSQSTKHIPRADFEKIYLESTLHPYLHARVEVGIMMGLRPGEVRGLRWSDINWDEKTMTIERQLQRVKDEGLVFRQVKQKEVRTLPLTQTQLIILETHRDYQSMNKQNWVSDEGLIFPNTIGRPLDAKREHKWWKDLLNRAGVKNYTIYQMRKTAFTHFANLGVPHATLLAYSGHTNIGTVMKHYAFSTSESMETALAGMDALRPTNQSTKELGD